MKGIRTKWLINQLETAVTTMTKVTAQPIPKATLIFLEMVTKGHIPRKYVKAILLVNIEANNIRSKLSIYQSPLLVGF